jgi:phenylalanyl-tRNA synthetase beta chain
VPAADPTRAGRVNRLLGTALAPDRWALLARVEVSAHARGRTGARLPPAALRPDLRIAAGPRRRGRGIHSYDRIPSTLPGALRRDAPPRARRGAVRSALVRRLHRADDATLRRGGETDALRLRRMTRAGAVRVVNPIQHEKPWLRTQLVASLLRTAAANRARQLDEVRAFEVARVFRAEPPGALPAEPIEAVALLARGSEQRLWGG